MQANRRGLQTFIVIPRMKERQTLINLQSFVDQQPQSLLSRIGVKAFLSYNIVGYFNGNMIHIIIVLNFEIPFSKSDRSEHFGSCRVTVPKVNSKR